MQSPATPNPAVVDVKRLDHLPLVGTMLRELTVKDTLDALIPPHERNEVTVGECVEALVLTILTGEHALSRVAETLSGYNMEVIFQRPMDAAHFHDSMPWSWCACTPIPPVLRSMVPTSRTKRRRVPW
jgi:Domain of unknown function (DUF4277)